MVYQKDDKVACALGHAVDTLRLMRRHGMMPRSPSAAGWLPWVRGRKAR